MAKIPRITGKNMLRFLTQQGFHLRRVVGSHRVMRKENAQTVVPVHGNDHLRIGTLHGILKDIHMKPDEFERLWNE